MVLLEMSVAFDHDIMFDVLRKRYKVQDAALDWFASYFADRTQVVVEMNQCSLSWVVSPVGGLI